MVNSEHILASRLSEQTQRECLGEVRVKKETTQVPPRKREFYTPFGLVLIELLESRGMSQTELGLRIAEITDRWSDPRAAVAKTFVQGRGITFQLCRAISQVLKLSSEEHARLIEAAEETKGL